jgi:hypothetical protein
MAAFTIDAAALRASLTTMLAFASTDSTIPVLYAVSVRPAAGSAVVEFAATDRFTAAWEIVPAEGDPFACLIPLGIARRLLTMIPKGTARRALVGAVTFTEADDGRVEARFIGGLEDDDVLETAVAWTPPKTSVGFPDLPALIKRAAGKSPAKGGPVVHLNPAYLARVTRALAPRSRGPLRVTHPAPLQPVLITLPADDEPALTAMIMPVRPSEVGRP